MLKTARLRTQQAEIAALTNASTHQAEIHAIPRRGYVLAAVAESYGAPIRRAVSTLREELSQTAFDSTEAPSDGRSAAELAAWNLTAAWIVAITLRELPATSSLTESTTWFGCGSLRRTLASISTAKQAEAIRILSSAAHGAAVSDLLPYILDPHGQASRLTVRRDPITKIARTQKKAEGVFYTPADVASYMADSSLLPLLPDVPEVSVFDPACGTGVFLRACLKVYKRCNPNANHYETAKHLLFGADIDPWAVDATAFVLLHDCWPSTKHQSRLKPAHVWTELRKNLACVDSLLLDPSTERPDAAPAQSSVRVPINRVFPRIGEGPRLIIGNPPYANVGPRRDLLSLANTFATLSETPRPTADVYPLFVEQMMRLAHPGSHGGALVLPLSIGCNSGRQFVATRRLIARTQGRWRFAFFDREPHALFGEDVKTRNAIAIWDRTEYTDRARIETGPLRKWRGYDRAAMFRSIDFTPFDGDISEGIPKVSGAGHARTLGLLAQSRQTLQHFTAEIGRVELAATAKEKRPTVFVGATAYNFINVFHRLDAPSCGIDEMLSEHPVHALHFASNQDAAIAFAVLSSHFAYWWWHVHDDGFHVSRSTIRDMPVGTAFLDPTIAPMLCDLGKSLWQNVRQAPVRSTNKGKVSFGFNAGRFNELRIQIDRLLMKSLQLNLEYAEELARFGCKLSSASIKPTAGDKTQ